MSDKCPKCRSVIREQRGIHDLWDCGSDGWDGVVCRQSDQCRIRELEAAYKAITAEQLNKD